MVEGGCGGKGFWWRDGVKGRVDGGGRVWRGGLMMEGGCGGEGCDWREGVDGRLML